jgi:hypothetical protein
MTGMKSQFLGISILGPTDSVYDDNAAFIGRDRLELDRASEIGVKTHRHTGLPGLENPAQPPSAAVVEGGSIPAAREIIVGYTLEDDQQGETELSPVAVVSTPSQILSPTSEILAELDYSAGALLANHYYYAITYADGEGGETPSGPVAVAVREPGFTKGQVKLSGLAAGMAEAGAVGWRLYRSIGGGTLDLLATGTEDAFVDDGAAEVDCSVHPPGEAGNTTGQASTLVVSLPAIAQAASFINVYGTATGDFSGASLLAQFPIASAGASAAFSSLEFLDSSPPDRNRSYGGAPKIDPDSEILDWHWKRPVAVSAQLPSGQLGDVRMVESLGALYGVLNASAGGPQDWTRLASGGGSGSEGPPGPEGPEGPPGPEGPAGPAGASGAPGPAGASGAPGPAGPEGKEGPAGPEGKAGASGAPGPAGASGAPGPEGKEGPPGPEGPMGLEGPEGPAGPKGETGASGAPGPEGKAGASGAPGPEGKQGPEGPKGETGAKGEKGDTGAKGETGASGAPGASGVEGPATWTPVVTTGVRKISESSFEKTSPNEQEGQLYSQEGFVRGCFVTWKISQNNRGLGLGLNTDPTKDAHWVSIDYFFNTTAAGVLLVRESGGAEINVGTYVAGDVLAITYDGFTVRYWKNGEVLRSVARAMGAALYLDSWWNQAGGKVTDVHFGPMGEAGASGAPGPTGPEGPEGPIGLEGPAGTPAASARIETDSVSRSASGRSNIEWKHESADNYPKGMLVFVAQASGSVTDQVAGVTINGASAMRIEKVTDEKNQFTFYAYFRNHVADNSTIRVIANGPTASAVKEAVAVSFEAELMARIAERAIRLSAGTEVAINLPRGEENRVYGFAIGSSALLGKPTSPHQQIDLSNDQFSPGTFLSLITRSENSGENSWAIWNKNFKVAMAVEIGLPQDYGFVDSLPERAGIGDTCKFIASSAEGVVWDLMYDGGLFLSGGGSFYRWKKVGGPPLQAQSDTARALNNQLTYASLPTDPLSITAPLKGDYDISQYCTVSTPAVVGAVGAYSYAIGAVAASDNWTAALQSPAAVAMGVDVSKTTRRKDVAKNDIIAEKARTGGAYECSFSRRRIVLDPIRVG